MSEKLIESLRSPACYPHEIAAIELLETHISWVVLTGGFVYKIKKPVDFGFLDFSTLGKRRFFCEEELRLNSRTSSGLYLEVVPISGSEDHPVIGGAGEAIEYAVKMRQFDRSGLLDALVQAGGLDDGDVASLGRKLADFHDRIAARPGPEEESLGTARSVEEAVRDNFRQIEPWLSGKRALAALEGLKQWSTDRMEALRELIAERRREGFVRECHGDLHLGNIARIDGEITFFDCIEFNPQFRWIDIQSELAFLLMDMEEKKLDRQANRLLNVYLEYSGDYEGVALLTFYKVYRAMVRAKVMVLQATGGSLGYKEVRRCWREYEQYIRLADRYCQQSNTFLAITHGVSGTGKSTVAARLAEHAGAIRIRSDVERKRLFGFGPDDRSEGDQKRTLYSESASDRTFARLEAMVARLLDADRPVIVDATFTAQKRRRPFRQLAENRGVPFVIVDCRASEETIRGRLAAREAANRDVSEANVEIMQQQLEKAEPLSEREQRHRIAIDTEQPPRTWIETWEEDRGKE